MPRSPHHEPPRTIATQAGPASRVACLRVRWRIPNDIKTRAAAQATTSAARGFRHSHPAHYGEVVPRAHAAVAVACRLSPVAVVYVISNTPARMGILAGRAEYVHRHAFWGPRGPVSRSPVMSRLMRPHLVPPRVQGEPVEDCDWGAASRPRCLGGQTAFVRGSVGGWRVMSMPCLSSHRGETLRRTHSRPIDIRHASGRGPDRAAASRRVGRC